MPGFKGHVQSCSDAVRTTPSECKCPCNGIFHGGPHVERATAVLAPASERRSYSNSRVTRIKGEAKRAANAQTLVGQTCTDYLVTDTVDALINYEPATSAEALRDLIRVMVEPFAKAIFEADLNQSQSQQIEAACLDSHLLCSLCVAILQIQESLEEAIEQVAEISATIISDDKIVSTMDDSIQATLRAALESSCKAALTNSWPLDPIQKKMIQLIGMITCPDISYHGDVRKYCTKPLIASWVSQVLYDWVDSGFANSSAFLGKRRRRR